MSRTDAVDPETGAPKWARLIHAVRGIRAELVHLLGFSFAMNLLVLSVPIFMIQVFDRVLTSQSMDTLVFLAIGTVAALSIMAMLDIIRGRILVRMGGAFEQSLGADLVEHGQLNRYGDLARLRQFINGPAVTTCLDIPWVPLFIALIFVIHPTLGWIALGGTIIMICLALITEKMTRSTVIASRGADEALGVFTQNIKDHQYANAAPFGLSQTWQSKLDHAIDKRTSLIDRVHTSVAFGRFFRLVFQVGLISGAAVLVTSGQITAGGMIAASVIATRALGPIERAQEAWRALVDARAQLSRLSTIRIASDRSDMASPNTGTTTIDAEGLAYMPSGDARPLFSGVSFSLKGGEMLGISGASNSGKSTLARLLTGHERPTQGRVRLNKKDVFSLGPNGVTPLVSHLSQAATLLPGTIAQNIASFANIPLDQIHDAAKLAGVDDAILDLPHGYKTIIGKTERALSAGIAQRVLLARTYCDGADLLVLDEPYTHLDNAGVSALLSALNELRRAGHAVIVISQRPSLLAQCDQVMVLQNGHAHFVEKRKKAELKVLEGSSAREIETEPMEAAQ